MSVETLDVRFFRRSILCLIVKLSANNFSVFSLDEAAEENRVHILLELEF